MACRYYAQKYPDVGDVVMVHVTSIVEMGAYVQLLEYNNIQGMILLSELSKTRIRSINKLIRIGKVEQAVVLRVDKEKGYIDLSKSRVSADEASNCVGRYKKGKMINYILCSVAGLLDYQSDDELEQLFRATAWYFDEKFGNVSSFDIFKQAVDNPMLLDECNMDAKTKEVLLSVICRKLGQKPVKICAKIEVAYYGYQGIEAVKQALMVGVACSTDDIPIRINLIASPEYVITTETLKRQDGLKALENAIEQIRRTFNGFDGDKVFSVQMAPTVVIKDEEVGDGKESEVENDDSANSDDEEDHQSDKDEFVLMKTYCENIRTDHNKR